MKFRFVGVCSSPKKERTTAVLVKEALEAAKNKVLEMVPDADVEIQNVSLANKEIKHCIDCGACLRKGTLCILKDDWLEAVDPLINPGSPDGVVFGSPVYFHSTNAQMRAYMERFTCLFKPVWHKDHPLQAPDFTKTVAGAVSVGFHRHGGMEEAVSSIISFLLSSGFLVTSSFNMDHGPVGYTGGTAWSGAPGVNKTDITLDEYGMLAARVLGERIGETAVIIRLGADNIKNEA